MASRKSNEPLERDITTKILKALRKTGGFWLKTHGSAFTANQPDIIGCYNGKYIALEVKRPSARDNLTTGQFAVLENIKDALGVAVVVTSVEEALASLEEL